MILKHKVEHKGEMLRVTFEVPLADVIAHLGDSAHRLEDALYRRVASYLVQRVPEDMWDVAQLLQNEGELGHVKWFDDQKGFGFIRTYDRQDVFVHHSQITGEGYRTIEQGQQVRFKRRFVSRQGQELVEAVDVEPIK